jgi:hypothetical protein
VVNFYSRFLPGQVSPARSNPLQMHSEGTPRSWEWPPVAAFKATLVAALPLAHPAPNAVLSLATDASDTHVGGVLQQLARGSWQPLAFYSKKLSGAGTRYSTFDRELLAASAQSDTSDFCWKGDVFACSLTTNHWSHSCSAPRRPGWPTNSDSYPSSQSLHRTSGQENMVADALSQPPPAGAQQPPTAQPTSPAPHHRGLARGGPSYTSEWPILAAIAEAQSVDFSAMASAQRSCPEVR